MTEFSGKDRGAQGTLCGHRNSLSSSLLCSGVRFLAQASRADLEGWSCRFLRLGTFVAVYGSDWVNSVVESLTNGWANRKAQPLKI